MSEEALLEEVRALERADLQALRAIWKVKIGAVPKVRSPALLRRILAWRMQAQAEGGLEASTRRQLAQSGVARSAGPQLGPGVRLTREWGGRLHEVEVQEASFLYGGRSYASLSSIATAITGVRWNGPRFFGLRKEKSR